MDQLKGKPDETSFAVTVVALALVSVGETTEADRWLRKADPASLSRIGTICDQLSQMAFDMHARQSK